MKISGGVSNLSFSFRGNDVVREAIHSAFLYHAIKAGMDMGIVNAGQLVVYEDIPKDLLEHVEDIIFNRRPDATERLVEFAGDGQGRGHEARARPRRGATATVEARLSHALVHGVVDFIEAGRRGSAAEVRAAARHHRRAADGRHEGRRRSVRRRQDVPAAGRQERARDEDGGRLSRAVHGGREASAQRWPRAARPSARRKGKIVLATVKGDVHDIGKNIVGVVLGCNSYEVVDLGVMVPADRILQTAIDEQADLIGLSGLITPSLDEMVFVAKEMERRGIHTAAAHRRRDDQPAAHGGEDRAGIRRGDGPRARRVARRRRRVEPAERRAARRRSSEANRALQDEAARAAQRARASGRCCRTRRRSRTGCTIDWAREPLPEPSFLGRRVLDDVPLETSCRTSTGRSSSPRGS